ncbi:MAG: hypothetical protein QM756_39840 [Polyangiaceae bacterium]
MVVTAVLAEVDPSGVRLLSRRLPKAIRADLDDSKRLVSHADFGLGEAWARALVGGDATSPKALLDHLLLESRAELSAPCPSQAKGQCWSATGESFGADEETCARIRKHVRTLAERGVKLLRVQTSVICTKRLNDEKERGVNRFVADLHAMERLMLSLRQIAGQNVQAVCGKVGGIADYDSFFGPLSGHLHTALEVGRQKSSYHFPALGQMSFVCDADSSDPLVSLSSLVGKYVRELLMARVVRFYPTGDEEAAGASGYHDPVTQAFVERSALLRRDRAVPDRCFERSRDEAAARRPRREASP